MGLAPGTLIWNDVLHFGVIRRARIVRRFQIASFHDDQVRCFSVDVSRVVPGRLGEDAGKRVDPGTRTQVVLRRTLTREIGIGAPYAKKVAGPGIGTAKTAVVGWFCAVGMLDPGLANLLKAIGIVRSAAHSIEILRNRRMIRIGHGNEMRRLVSGIARGYSYRETSLGSATSILGQSVHVSRNDVRS